MMVRGAELEGYCMDLLGALAGMLRFQYRVKVVGDGQYGAVAAGGNWTGMIGEVLRRVTPSLCSRPTAGTGQREQRLGFLRVCSGTEELGVLLPGV